jgi:carbamoyl-phosphate synthase large subunit
VPYLSKVTGIPMVQLATRTMMGDRLADLGYSSGLWTLSTGRVIPESEFIKGTPAIPAPTLYAVKAPVFSFQKLALVEPSLGPEMKSTGEVLGIDRTYVSALYKALVASGIQFRPKGKVILTVREIDKDQAVEIARRFVERGYEVACTPGTGEALRQGGVKSDVVNKIKDGSPNLLELLFSGGVSLMINTPEAGQKSGSDASRIRRACIETGVACITSIDTAQALADALEVFEDPSKASCEPFVRYVEGAKPVVQ